MAKWRQTMAQKTPLAAFFGRTTTRKHLADAVDLLLTTVATRT
jgi:hypothetical protein